MKFKKIEIPYIADRFIGLSKPLLDVIYVISYEGIHKVDLKKVVVESFSEFPEDGNMFNENTKILSFEKKQIPINGLYGSSENRSFQGNTISINDSRLTITDSKNKEIFKFNFEDLSGDWIFASFSDDGKYIVLGLPYDLFVFQYIS